MIRRLGCDVIINQLGLARYEMIQLLSICIL
jgi:hypothetical protein